MPKVALLMGSINDFDTLTDCVKTLKKFKVDVTARVLSAHRTPGEAAAFASSARMDGYDAIICAAGKAAHLAGVVAAHTTLPVIGIPIKSSTLDGLDALLSTVQMPPGIPVATVAIDGAVNAALLAVQMLSLRYPELEKSLLEHKKNIAQGVLAADEQLRERLETI